MGPVRDICKLVRHDHVEIVHAYSIKGVATYCVT